MWGWIHDGFGAFRAALTAGMKLHVENKTSSAVAAHTLTHNAITKTNTALEKKDVQKMCHSFKQCCPSI